jgi:putative tryptophan/tyrosine transport system substrate-binding protein
MDRASGPRMPRIKKLVRRDPVGVPSSCCTTRSVRIYPWRRIRRSRAPSSGPGTFFAAQFSAGYTTNISGFDLRQAQPTTTVPIVFETGADPIQIGLVASLNRPGGNVTGVTQTNLEIAQKRLELLHELLPLPRVMALLVDPRNPAVAETTASQMLEAARTLGLELHVLNAGTEKDFDAAFAKISQLRASGLVISAGTSIFVSRSGQLAALAARYAVPAVGANRAFVVAGGLMHYGADVVDAYRLTSGYVGRILRGAAP